GSAAMRLVCLRDLVSQSFTRLKTTRGLFRQVLPCTHQKIYPTPSILLSCRGSTTRHWSTRLGCSRSTWKDTSSTYLRVARRRSKLIALSLFSKCSIVAAGLASIQLRAL